MLDLTHAFIYNADRHLNQIAALRVSMKADKRPYRKQMESWPYHAWLQLSVITTKVESKYSCILLYSKN